MDLFSVYIRESKFTTNIFTAGEIPPEKKKMSLVVYISVKSFNSFTYEMDPNC